uniref:Uncharacterized protein n=2 Tax=Magallana gigas TaxID=29159 RepID=A0A8W8LNU0_MAGGI|nr:uncharacterized protein LOC105347200 isoform X4 [Crassostrea gigas]
MAESAYHMEALRRQRVIDRKRAALDKMVNGGSQDTGPNVEQANAKNPILFSGPGDYDTNRCIYNWIGTERCRRQYDHSRNGPILPSSWQSLQRELNSIGRGTPLLAGEGRPSRYDDLLALRKVSFKK